MMRPGLGIACGLLCAAALACGADGTSRVKPRLVLLYATCTVNAEYLSPCVGNYYEEPIVLESGAGSSLRDVDGREYLDFFGGVLTVSILVVSFVG